MCKSNKPKLNKPTEYIIVTLLIIIACMVMPDANADDWKDDVYFKVGAGYKLNENTMYIDGIKVRKAITARFVIGYQVSDRLSVGYTHRSQWSEGAPFNKRGEYAVDELFIDYKFTLSDMF